MKKKFDIEAPKTLYSVPKDKIETSNFTAPDMLAAFADDSIEHRDGKPGVVVRGKGWTPVTLGRASAGMHIVEAGLDSGDEVAL